MEIGSSINYILGNSNFIKPEVGMPVTILYWSDRKPGTIINVSKSGKRVDVQFDDYMIIKGSEHDGSAEYEFMQNSENEIVSFSLRKNGSWTKKNNATRSGLRLCLGRRERYYDPNF